MLFLLNSDYGAMKKTLKLNRFSAKFWASRHKMYITAIFMHVVLEQYKNKIYDTDFKATLTLETRNVYICKTHCYERETCDSLEMKLTKILDGIQQDGAAITAAKSVTPVDFTCGHWLQKVRYKFLFEVRYVRWGSFVDFHWSISLAYSSDILLTWKLWNWGDIAPLPPLQATDQRRNLWLNEVYVHTAWVIWINQHDYQQSWQISLRRNLYAVSTDNPAICLFFLFFHWIYARETFTTVMQLWNLHNCIIFNHKILGGIKDMSPPVQKLEGHISPSPLNSLVVTNIFT